MEILEERRQRVYQEKQLSNRLQLATTRLEAAQQERLWAIVAAYEAGLSIRKIAAATGLSSSRVHQLLSDEEAHEVPQWLSLLRQPESSSAEGMTTGSVSGVEQAVMSSAAISISSLIRGGGGRRKHHK